MIVLADRPVEPSETVELRHWVENGGLLLRFAGPRSAETTDELGQPVADPLMPERLLAEDRQLGGALSWSQPAKLAAFGLDSPFAGLTVPDEVTVNRQVLAEPSAQLASHTWARLADGTPLVTEAARGSGRIVLFHVTANADWSNLPLSGLFPDMLRRLVALSAGVSAAPDAQPLSPAETLDGFGVLGQPPPAASGLPGTAFATTPVSPQHPPGLYGPQAGRRALNLSNAMGPLAAATAVPGSTQQALNGGVRERAIGPWLVAAGLAILAFDLADRAAAAWIASPGVGSAGAACRASPRSTPLAALASRLGDAARLHRVRRPGGRRHRPRRARRAVGLREQPDSRPSRRSLRRAARHGRSEFLPATLLAGGAAGRGVVRPRDHGPERLHARRRDHRHRQPRQPSRFGAMLRQGWRSPR